MGVGFLTFDFLTRKENELLISILGVHSDWTSDILKSLDDDGIFVHRASRFSDEERAEMVCKLLCRVFMQDNEAGREAFLKVVELRGRGISDEELKLAKDQLVEWEHKQTEWAIEYYDDYSKQVDGSTALRQVHHHLWIRNAISISLDVAHRYLDAVRGLAPPAEPLEKLSLLEAANVFAEIANIKPDKSRITREIRQGHIKRTEDGRLTTAAVAKRAWKLFQAKQKRKPVTQQKTKGKVCPQCGEPTHMLIGSAKTCRVCFVKVYIA